MKRVYSGSVSKIDEKKEPIEGAIDYSELSESILTNQIKVDLRKIQRYAEKSLDAINGNPERGGYSLFLMVQEYVEEVADCFDALHKKIREKESKR